MVIAIRLIGAFIAAMGLALALSPKGVNQAFDFFSKGKRIYWIGLLRILFGIIFLLAASVCRWTEVIRVLGVLFIIAGSFIFILGIRKVKSVLEWWSKKPALILRLLTLLAVAFGILIIYAA
jgi:hypothetical protein